MSERRKFVRMFFIALVFGLFSFMTILTRPSFAAIRTVDVIHLIGVGMCLGAALVALILFVRSSPST
jgi:hypothetical protein